MVNSQAGLNFERTGIQAPESEFHVPLIIEVFVGEIHAPAQGGLTKCKQKI